MYFALAGMMETFHYLHYGLAVILVLIGAKMLAAHYYVVPTHISLAGVAAVLGLSIMASIVFPEREEVTTDAE
jgi:tellurite resistance protein TerC